MQAYEEVENLINVNTVPFLFLFLRINAKSFYILYIFHDLFWSLIFLVFGILLRIEIIDPASYLTIFGQNYANFVYVLISFGGFFLCLVVLFAGYTDEIPFNLPKKIYIIWRIIISILHFLLCVFIVIFFGIFDTTMKTILLENKVSIEVIYDLQTYTNYGLGIFCFLVVYSMLNIFNCFTLMKACKKIRGNPSDDDQKLNSKANDGWMGKVVPLS